MGKKWYLKCIESENTNLSSNMRFGEYCTTYSYPEHAQTVAKRIKREFSDVKIIASIRNPVERAYSDYLRSVRRGEIKNEGLKHAIYKNRGFITLGFYYPIIKNFQESFGVENVQIIKYDDIAKTPLKTLKNIFSFIGVDEAFCPPEMTKKMGETYQPKNQNFELILGKFQRLGKSFSKFPFLSLFKSPTKNLINYFRRINTTSKDRDFDFEVVLREIYSNDIENTGRITGLDLSSWQ